MKKATYSPMNLKHRGHALKTCKRPLTDGRCAHCDSDRRSMIGTLKRRDERSGRAATRRAKSRASYKQKKETKP